MTQAVIPQWRLCDRLARALDESHLTVQQMADVLGVDRNTVGNYLHGRTRPRDAVLRVWAMETGVDLDWLRGGPLTSGVTPGYLWTPWYADMHDPPCSN
jgi:transcriptional regulator with XRE-family HTH domain